jgi:sugar lactone lactonase YvrE
MKIELLVDVKTQLGEGPLWDVEDQRLYWVDSTGKKVFCCTAEGAELRAWDVPETIGSMAIRKNGNAIVSLANGFHLLDFQTGAVELIHDPEPDMPHSRLNDGKVDKCGRFIVGSMDVRETGKDASIYRLDPDLTVHRIDSGITVSNGPCWSPDGKIFYFADSWAGELWAYDYDLDTGTVANRRVFAKLQTPGDGLADGSTVDAEGYVWNAQVFDGQLVRYAPDGSIDRIIDMPVRRVTSLMFGGPDLDVLYVTSMALNLQPHLPADPVQRGGLFAVYGLGIKGLPETRFAG